MPVTADEALSWVGKLYEVIRGRQPEVEKFDRYYRGEQPLTMASDIWREFHEKRYATFADNWCGVVTDAPAQRLGIAGLRLDDDNDVSEGERLLLDAWRRNDMERQSAMGIPETLKSRRSSVLVWADEDGGPSITWESPEQTAVAYDPEFPSRRVAGLKVWCDDTTEFATLYTPDGLWKWERPIRFRPPSLAVPPSVVAAMERDRQWQPREVAGEPWPLPNPLGVVPLVEVRNRGVLRGEPVSEIGGVVPMQDAINLLWAYLFTSADHASFPARVVMGMEAPSLPKLDADGNDTGQRIPVDLKSLANGRLLFLDQEGSSPSIGQWDAAKLDVFTDVIEMAVGHIAAQTRTPQHYLILGRNANPAAADALTAAEAGLVAKVHDLHTFLGADLVEVFRLVALVGDDRALADLVRSRGSIVFDDPENRSEAQKADAATKWRSVGMPLEIVAEKFWSNDPNELARIMAAVESESDDPTMARIMREFRSLEPEPAGVTDGAEG